LRAQPRHHRCQGSRWDHLIVVRVPRGPLVLAIAIMAMPGWEMPASAPGTAARASQVERVAFLRDRRLYLMDVDGRNQRRVRGFVVQGFPSWSPDGRRLGFASAGEKSRIWVAGANGRQPRAAKQHTTRVHAELGLRGLSLRACRGGIRRAAEAAQPGVSKPRSRMGADRPHDRLHRFTHQRRASVSAPHESASWTRTAHTADQTDH
jgi:hypothetical protein